MMFDGKKADDKKDRLSLLYEKYGGKMFAAAKRIVGSTSDAEDALHNAFLSVAKRIGEIDTDDDDSIRGYLFTIVKNEAINILRSETDGVGLDDAADASEDVVLEFERREAYECAVEAIRAMDERYRAPLYLTVVMGHSANEAASILKRTPGTVRMQISRAKKILQKKLKEAGYEL